jgi:hypothetical protein
MPQVYAWSSNADNIVGAEYIIMEKCPVIELEKVWETITGEQKAAITMKLASYDISFVSSAFSMYGSLYYS